MEQFAFIRNLVRQILILLKDDKSIIFIAKPRGHSLRMIVKRVANNSELGSSCLSLTFELNSSLILID